MLCRSAAAIAVWGMLCAAPALGAEVDRDARARVARDGRARVVVELVEPAPLVDAAVPAMPALRARVTRLRARVERALPAREVTVVRRFSAIPGFAAEVSAAGLDALAAHPDVRRVDADMEGGGGLASSVAQIAADRVRARGITGAGVTVAILDTGVDARHPDLRAALAHEECFCLDDCCPGGAARASGPGSAAGVHLHGTHVAGIVLSRGVVSAPGVAPQARFVAVRVLDDENRGSLVDWIAALDWIVAERPEVRVVNMSLVSDALFAGNCDDANVFNRSFTRLIGMLRQRGTVVAAAAGNEGRADALTAPACVSPALAIGAVTGRDAVANFSNGGETLDLLAPGVAILSDALGGGLTVLSGTSMAAAHAAGALALLAAFQPGAGAAGLEEGLRAGGRPVVDERNARTVPRVDTLGALNVLDAHAEFLRGGGSRRGDCLLEWNFIPPTIARQNPRAVADCRDGDVLCDLDAVSGQCTFLLSLCFNLQDPRLPACSVDEALTGLTVAAPRPDAPAGSAERVNAGNLLPSLPAFPITAANVCTPPVPLVVRQGRVETIRVAVESATRRDADGVALRCLP